MPNIGKELEKRLIMAGIVSPSQLMEVGSIGAFQRLHAFNAGLCINMLYALEGAIQNVRWHKLEENKKQELLHYYYEILRSGK